VFPPLVTLDLDHFKVFNDEHGHQTGDLLLQTAVRGWRSGLRSSDTIARYGGEEFAILALARSLGLNVPAPATLWTGLALEMLREGQVGMVYQPVVRLADRVIIGYEALARPDGVAPEATVDGLFVAAQRMGMTREIDYLCRRNPLQGARELPQNSTLFINISVAALLDPEHDLRQGFHLGRPTRLNGRRSDDATEAEPLPAALGGWT
jgi:GGDEF domain-containing protein